MVIQLLVAETALARPVPHDFQGAKITESPANPALTA
jgi:hypothetical protein